MQELTRFIMGTSIATVMSALTIIAVTAKPEMKNLGGFIWFCYTVAYTGCMILLTIHGLLYQYLEHFVDSYLYIWTKIGSIYFFSATMFWLNVMSFEIWTTFRKLRSNPRANIIEGQNRKFVRYSIYAWGSPLVHIIVIRLYSLSETGADSVTTDAIKACLPTIGITIYGICMLISTAFIIKQRMTERRETGHGFERKFFEYMQWFFWYVILFVMMTLFLILMVIGLFTDWIYPLTSLVEKQSIITFFLIFSDTRMRKKNRERHREETQVSSV